MNKQQLDPIIEKVKQVCKSSGARLTDKRCDILTILLYSKIPLSAYEISDNYNKTAKKSMPTMSVYRILDFLESENLAHKLNSTSKYVACSAMDCGHVHQIPQFLICSECQSAKEIAVSAVIFEALGKLVDKAGYTLANSKLELQCLCSECSAGAA